jgi:hypothetical protein
MQNNIQNNMYNVQYVYKYAKICKKKYVRTNVEKIFKICNKDEKYAKLMKYCYM